MAQDRTAVSPLRAGVVLVASLLACNGAMAQAEGARSDQAEFARMVQQVLHDSRRCEDARTRLAAAHDAIDERHQDRLRAGADWAKARTDVDAAGWARSGMPPFGRPATPRRA